jgi:membrane-bound metal-dependent hydrolase YbcI (DUF457 family)
MKGFTHFISATAIGSCVPGAAAYAVEHTSYILVLGGVFGLLPDTLDFKLNRFIHRYDERFDPGQEPDPSAIAAVVARNIERACAENRTVNLHLHTIKVGADMWREYTVMFDEASQDIVTEIGPVVNTGKVPVPASEPEENRVGRAHVSCTFKQDYSTLTRVNIFSGPSFGFKPRGGHVDINFIPWHRGWSHSLTMACFLGLVVWGIISLINNNWLYPGWMFGLVVALGFSTHVLEDQLGHLGSNLFFPFTSERTSGFKTMHANDALPNFLTVWLSLALLFWNLYRVTPDTFFRVHISGWSYLLYVVVIPVALMIGGSILMRRSMKAPAEPPPEEEEEEML